MARRKARVVVSTLTAAARVFGTVELLEAVLMHTNLQTLAILQRVNCTFKRTITESRHLQDILLCNTPETAVSSPHHGELQCNDFLSNRSIRVCDKESTISLALEDGQTQRRYRVDARMPALAFGQSDVQMRSWQHMRIHHVGSGKTISCIIDRPYRQTMRSFELGAEATFGGLVDEVVARVVAEVEKEHGSA